MDRLGRRAWNTIARARAAKRRGARSVHGPTRATTSARTGSTLQRWATPSVAARATGERYEAFDGSLTLRPLAFSSAWISSSSFAVGSGSVPSVMFLPFFACSALKAFHDA